MAVLDEGRNEIPTETYNDEELASTHETNSGGSSQHDKAKIDEGLRLLNSFYPIPVTDYILTKLLQTPCHSSPWPVIRMAWQSVKQFLLEAEKEPDRDGAMRALLTRIFSNTNKPLGLPGSASMLEYAESICGKRIRWETIALLFAAIGHTGSVISPRLWVIPGQEDAQKSRRALCHKAIAATHSCLNFLSEVGALNDVVLWILCDYVITLSQIHGDSSRSQSPTVLA